jgi:hypothetical protein
VLAYVTGFVKPLLEKIDTVDYTKKSRELKVAEEYATRLMRVKYDEGTARDIARKLVENYPTHGFVIDSEEASTESASMMDFGTGLKTSLIPPSLAGPLDDIMPYLHTITAIGRIEEVAV